MSIVAAELPDDQLAHLRRDTVRQRCHMDRLLEILRLERLLDPWSWPPAAALS